MRNFEPLTSLAELYALWKKLGDIPTGFEGELVDCIEEPFEGFEIGTHREDIWHWFESQHPAFIVGEVMQGMRPTDAEYKNALEATAQA